jgi:cytochrome c-type biogenesis protein CcmF
MGMELGEIFIIAAGILLAFDFVLLLKAPSGEGKGREYAHYAFSIACALIVAAYLSLVWAFLTDNFSLREVYTYSSSSLSIWYKFGDPWIGSSGSMLFLTFLFTIVCFMYRLKESEKEKRSSSRITLYTIADLFLLFFILVILLHSPFERFPMTLADGSGLNPLLQTFWVLIHPPVVFLGYAFVFFAFALTLAGMVKGEVKEQERGTLRRSLYAAWLCLALGIALGGWWSYEVLGWGGYWAWDPVETASLLPWLALTAYFHVSRGTRDMAKEFTLLITVLTVIFCTALTRGGLLESVHAFGKSPVGPALMLFAAVIIICFFYLWWRAKRPLYTLDVNTHSLYSLSLFVAYWSLLFTLFICFFGIAAPIVGGFFSESPLITSAEFYNRWCYPFMLAFVAALLGCNTSAYLNVKGYGGLILVVLGVGVLLAWLEWPTANPFANLGLPLLLTAVFAIAYNFALALQQQKQKQKEKKYSRLMGKTIVHLALIIILLGVFVSSAAEEESDFIFAEPNSTTETLGTQIELHNFSIYTGTGSVYSPQHQFIVPEYSALRMNVTIGEGGGNSHHGSLWLYFYTNHGLVSKPAVISTPTEDIYLYMQYTASTYNSLLSALRGQKVQPGDFILRVKRVPLIWLIWIGIVLLSIGMVVLLVGDFISRRH